ncbi:hypothetical protein FBQ83_11365 [Chloroflexi bacterium CFX5]|nr:hypothetical protein [Chloroflexota bacterium]MDL1919906.1 hypothetical protein [Chloroflexi bacterium CFX5]
MNKLKWWFRIVGALYILLGVGFAPALNAARLPMILPGVETSGVTYHGLLDFSFMFGLDLLVTGAFMLWASRDPLKNVSIVWLVVALEIVRGILDDLYMILQGYAAPFYIGFIVLHLVIIVTGIQYARQAKEN